MIRVLVVVLCSVLKATREIREIWNVLTVFGVALDRSVAEAKRTGCIGIGIQTALSEANLRDSRSVPTFDRVDLIVILFAKSSSIGVDCAHQHDQRIRGCLNRSGASFVKLLANGNIVQLRVADGVLRNFICSLAV